MIDTRESKTKLELKLVGQQSSRNHLRTSNQINTSTNTNNSITNSSPFGGAITSRTLPHNMTPKRQSSKTTNCGITGSKGTSNGNNIANVASGSLNEQIHSRLQANNTLTKAIQGKTSTLNQQNALKKSIFTNNRNVEKGNPIGTLQLMSPTPSGSFSQDKMNAVLKNNYMKQKNNINMHLAHKNQILQQYQQNQQVNTSTTGQYQQINSAAQYHNINASLSYQNQSQLSHQISQLDITHSSPKQEQQGLSPSFSTQILDTSQNINNTSVMNDTRTKNSYLTKGINSGSATNTPSSYIAASKTTAKTSQHNYQKYLQNTSKSTKDSSFIGGSVGCSIQTNHPLSSGSISSITNNNGSRSSKCLAISSEKSKGLGLQNTYLKKSQLAVIKNQNSSNLMLNNSTLINNNSFLKHNHSRSPLGSSGNNNISNITQNNNTFIEKINKENTYLNNQLDVSSEKSILTSQQFSSSYQQSSPFSYLEGKSKGSKSPKQSNSVQMVSTSSHMVEGIGNANFFSSHLSRKKNFSTTNYSGNNYTPTGLIMGGKQESKFSQSTQMDLDQSPIATQKRVLSQSKNEYSDLLLKSTQNSFLDQQNKMQDHISPNKRSDQVDTHQSIYSMNNNSILNRMEQNSPRECYSSTANVLPKSYLAIETLGNKMNFSKKKQTTEGGNGGERQVNTIGDKIGQNNKNNLLTMNELEMSFQNEQQEINNMQNITSTQNDQTPSGYYYEEESNFLNCTNFLNSTNLQIATQNNTMIQKNENFSQNTSQIFSNNLIQPSLSSSNQNTNAFNNSSVCANSILNNTINNILQNMSYNQSSSKASHNQNIIHSFNSPTSLTNVLQYIPFIMMSTTSNCDKLPMDTTPRPILLASEPLSHTKKCMSLKSVLYDQIMPTIRPITRQFKLINKQLYKSPIIQMSPFPQTPSELSKSQILNNQIDSLNQLTSLKDNNYTHSSHHISHSSPSQNVFSEFSLYKNTDLINNTDQLYIQNENQVKSNTQIMAAPSSPINKPLKEAAQPLNNKFWKDDAQNSNFYEDRRFKESSNTPKASSNVISNSDLPSEKDQLTIQQYNFSFSNCVNQNQKQNLQNQPSYIQITTPPSDPHFESTDSLLNTQIAAQNLKANFSEMDGQKINYDQLLESSIISPQKPVINLLLSQQITVVDGITHVSSHMMSIDQNEYSQTSPYNDNLLLSHFWSIEAFQVGKCLGRGRFGNVYLTRHKATNMLFAIKQINKKSLIESCMEKQLQQEIKIQTYLNHPNILKMHGFFDDQQKIYLILELASHGDIYKEIKREHQKRFSEEKAANYIRQVCEGLTYLHSQGIIHRDIKPENILNSYGVLKLSDFGWSIYTEEKRMTFCGTLDYVSPEVVSGKDYDFKVDIWSIGVLTFELITGKPPFENRQNQNESYQKILMVKYDFPNYITNEAKDFMSKLLVGDPNKRISLDMALNHEWIIKNTRNCLADWDPKVSEESLYLLK